MEPQGALSFNQFDDENLKFQKSLINGKHFLPAINSQEEALVAIAQDFALLSLSKSTQFSDISIAKTYEISEAKYLYKPYLKNEQHGEIYKQFKGLKSELRQEKLPFRVIDQIGPDTIIDYFGVMFRKDYRETQEARKLDDQLSKISGLDKEPRKQALREYERDLLKNTSLAVLELASKIKWWHGTNSSLLPFLPHTEYSLIPTGKLLDRGLAPMSGEISDNGTTCEGINQTQISVETIKGMWRCWQYASKISHSFDFSKYDTDPKSLFTKVIQELAVLTPDQNGWDRTLISLYRLKQWNPIEFQSLCLQHAEEIQELKAKFATAHSKNEMLMLKALDYDSGILKDAFNKASETQKASEAQVFSDFPMVTPLRWESLLGITCKPFLPSFIDDHCIKNHLSGRFFYNSEIFADNLGRVLALKIHGQENINYVFEKMHNPDLSKRQRKGYKKLWEDLLKLDPSEMPHHERVLNNMIRPIMESRIKKNVLPYVKRLQRFERLFEEQPIIFLSQDDKTFLTDPIPLLFASTTSKSSGGEQGQETNVKQPLLGREIDLVIVDEKHADKVKGWLADNHLATKVHVYHSSILTDLKNVPLYHAAGHITCETPLLKKKALTWVNEIVQKRVIPIYRQPYPDQTERKWHGVPHAMRVLLFTHVIASLYSEVKSPNFRFATRLENLLVGGSAHDIARKNDGVDLWDKESGEQCQEILFDKDVPLDDRELMTDVVPRNVPLEDAELIAYAIAEKDNKSPKYLEQKVIHDADCLDILRCLSNVKDFMPEELWIMQDLDKEVGYQLIEEAKVLIGLTETSEIKDFITGSKDPLKCLYQILFHVHDHYGKCGLIAEHLSHSQNAFNTAGQYLLNETIEKLIKTYLGG